jgi:hypothetical protein
MSNIPGPENHKRLSMFQWTKKRKIAFWTILGSFVVYSLVGLIGVPMVTRHILEKKVSQTINRQVKVDKVRANPFTLALSLTGLSISDKVATNLFTLDQANVNVQIRSLFSKALIIRSLMFDGPGIHAVRTAADRFNFSDLIEPRPDEGGTTSEEGAAPPRIVVERLEIVNGRIQFDDRTLAAPFSTTFSQMGLTVTALDTAPQSPAAAVEFSTRTESNETIALGGQFSPAPLAATVTIDCRAIDFVKYVPYYQPYWNASMAKGTLDLQAAVSWSPAESRVEKAGLKVADLAINHIDSDTPLLHLPIFQIQNARIDLNAHTVELGRVNTQDGAIWASRQADGRISLVDALTAGMSAETTDPAAASDTVPPEAKPPAPGLGWTLSLADLSITNYRMEFTDLTLAQPAKFSLVGLKADAQSLTTREGETGEISLSMGWNDQGTVAVTGQVGLIPLQVDLTVSALDLDIRPLQPYVNEQVGLVITSGQFNTKGKLRLKDAGNGPLGVGYDGQVFMVNFKSLDAAQKADFFNFSSLYLNKLQFEAEPLRLSIEEVALTDFFSKILIAADGSTNIKTIFGDRKTEAGTQDADGEAKTTQTEAVTEADATSPPESIQIKMVTLQGGSIDFSDLNVKPAVRLPMEKVGGRISGLDAIAENTADVLLEGLVRGNVPIKIAGKINPLITPPFADVNLSFTSVDLSPFTPYAEKYLGYELTKGQLSVDLSYLIKDNTLEAKNNAVLTKLTLGDSVPSPSATKLPIKLAIALLKDRNGNIDLDLPVRGELDDPEFSISGLVFRMLGNLILEIVTSPFKMLGAMFGGGGEELSYIDFEAGEETITAESGAKLENVAKILFERPQVNLEIQGQVAPETDTEGLREFRFDRELKAAKLKTLMAGGQPAVPLEQISISGQERDQMILEAYAAAQIPKPRDETGKEKALSSEEMEKILYTAIAITEDDLRHLAVQRSQAAKSYLLNTGKVEPSRLFVVEPEMDAKPDGATQQQRVQFSIK